MSARRWVGAVVVVAMLTACGGGAPGARREADEVSERWTAGDDAPLEGEGGGEEEGEEGE